MKKIICNYSSLSMDTTTFMVCLFAEVGISLKNIGSKFNKILHACSAAELTNLCELDLDQWITDQTQNQTITTRESDNEFQG